MNVDTLLAIIVALLAVATCASSFIAYREIKRHHDYLKEIK
jgi:hypothetical protein